MNIKRDEFFNISIRGASHFKSGKPMQDYSLSYKGDGWCLGIVCDGHGADKHFRSDVGSKTAANVCSEKLLEFYTRNPTFKDLSSDTAKKLARLKLAIISAWQNGIEEYTRLNPFTATELDKLASKSFASVKDYDITQPYGTTMLAAFVCREYYLVMMIGDGAIVKITPDLKAEYVKFAGKAAFDDQPHGATDSMCLPNCFDLIYFDYEKLENAPGVCFALCTDGLSEAFAADETLFKMLKNYLNFYAEEGRDKSIEAITAQLNEISKRSSAKDDISLAFATNSLDMYDTRPVPNRDDAQGEKYGGQ